jgi:hypothetical protein
VTWGTHEMCVIALTCAALAYRAYFIVLGVGTAAYTTEYTYFLLAAWATSLKAFSYCTVGTGCSSRIASQLKLHLLCRLRLQAATNTGS